MKLKKHINWTKFEVPNTGVVLPGYINNSQYPFTIQYGVTKDLKWTVTDNKELYKQNLIKKHEKWHYRNKEVIYKVNNDGYRTYEWQDIDWKNSVVLLGCSCTFGVGLAEDETISYYLEKLINKQVINLGVPGASNQVILNNAVSTLKYFEAPISVVNIWTSLDRLRLYDRNEFFDIGVWSTFKHHKKMFEYYVSNLYHRNANNLFLKQYSDLIWKDKSFNINISFFPDTAKLFKVEKFFIIDQEARDNLHPSRFTAKEIAEFVFKRLKDESVL